MKLRILKCLALSLVTAWISAPAMAAECDVTILGDCARAYAPERNRRIGEATRGIVDAISNSRQSSNSPTQIDLAEQRRRNISLPRESACLEGSWSIRPTGSDEGIDKIIGLPPLPEK